MVLSHPTMNLGSVMGNDAVPVWSSGGPLRENEITGPKTKTKLLKAVNIIGENYVTKEERFLSVSPETNAKVRKKLNNRKIEALHILHEA